MDPEQPVVKQPAFQSSATITQIVAALAKAQGEFPRIPKNKTVAVRTKTGGSYTFSYAPLETIMDAVRPVLAGNGIAVVQMVTDKSVTTLLLHTSGEWLMSQPLPIRISEEASNSSQALGSAITYAKRYSLSPMLGVVADDDDDGNAADGNDAKVTKDETPHGKIDATTKALTGKSVNSNLHDSIFVASLRAAAQLGSTKLKQVWNGGSKEDRLAVPPQDWETIKLMAQAADKNDETGAVQ